MSTYVLIHGAFAGGWQFKQVEAHLRQKGHIVYRPTLTGLGERVHLATPDLELSTNIQDILNVFKFEELEDVYLVGYSLGGVIATGVAEQIPARIKHLIYLDAMIPEDGQSIDDLLGPEIVAEMEKAADAYGDGWRVPPDPPHDPRIMYQPRRMARQPLSVTNPEAAKIPRTFIHLTHESNYEDPVLHPIISKARVAKADPNWGYYEIYAEHGYAWETHPQELADILLKISDVN